VAAGGVGSLRTWNDYAREAIDLVLRAAQTRDRLSHAWVVSTIQDLRGRIRVLEAENRVLREWKDSLNG
jgi:cytosine/adenosine deaminase-related metal-dependent hydrolase